MVSLVSSLTTLAVSGCKDSSKSKINESSSGEVGAGGGNNPGSQAAQGKGTLDVKIKSQEYFSPKGQSFVWTDTMTDQVVSSLPTTCDGDRSWPGWSETVAIAITGDCKAVAKPAAQKEISELGTMLAAQGTNLLIVVRTDAGSKELTRVEAATPKVDLGAIVERQKANSEKNQGQMSADAGIGFKAEDGWVGGARIYNIGSDQFSASASGSLFFSTKQGLGLHSFADVNGRAFGAQRSLIFAKIDAQALAMGKQASIDLGVQIFGQDAFALAEIQPALLSDNKNLLSVNHTLPGSLNFAVGPVPFNVSWAFRLSGSVPASYKLTATSASGGISPNVAATVSLEGGPDIKVAKAGVDGSFTLVDAGMSGDAVVGTSTTTEGKPAICYNSDVQFYMRQLLGGSLSAYAQIGRPNEKVKQMPLGWRGDMKFVDWKGMSHFMPILVTGEKCISAQS